MRSLYICVLILLAMTATQSPMSAKNLIKSSEKTKVAPKIKFKLTTGLIKENGNIIPVARTTFVIHRFSSSDLKRKIEKEKEDSKPTFEKLSQVYSSECAQSVGSPAQKKLLFNRCVYSKLDVEMKKWKNEVDSEFEIRFQDKLKQQPETVTIKTDLSGQTMIELNPGIWYIKGSYSYLQNKSNIYWDFKVDVKPGLEKIELSNDNGEIINLD